MEFVLIVAANWMQSNELLQENRFFAFFQCFNKKELYILKHKYVVVIFRGRRASKTKELAGKTSFCHQFWEEGVGNALASDGESHHQTSSARRDRFRLVYIIATVVNQDLLFVKTTKKIKKNAIRLLHH